MKNGNNKYDRKAKNGKKPEERAKESAQAKAEKKKREKSGAGRQKKASPKKKGLLIALSIISGLALTAAIFAAAVFFGVYSSSKERMYDKPGDLPADDYDCIFILGCGVHDDGSPSSMLEDRLLTGLSLYEAGAAKKIIVSGDHGTVGYDEVNTMKDFLIERGVPSEDIFMDHAGFSTYDSTYRASHIFGVKKMIVVTQRFHLSRALYIAKKLGIEANGVCADLHNYRGIRFNYIREIPARSKDFLSCLFRVRSRILGESIDITGSGDVTNDK